MWDLHLWQGWVFTRHTLCFEAWEGKDKGKEDRKGDAMKSGLEKDGLFLVMAKVLRIFLPLNLADPAFSEATFKDFAGLVLLTFPVQEPKVDVKNWKFGCIY